MNHRPNRYLILAALGLAQLPLHAQQDNPDVRKPFRFSDDSTPVPRAVPVQRIPRAIPVTKPGASPAPDPGTVSPPKPMTPPEPEDPGTIHITPKGDVRTPDQVQLDLADSYYAKKNWEQAAPEYERYLGQYLTGGDRPTAYFRVAECYRHIGNFNAAKNAYENLLSQYGNGDFVGPAAYRLADIYYQAKEFRDALVLYRKASVRLKDPTVAAAAKFFTGRCLEAIGDKLEARACYEDLVAQPKDNPFYDASRLSLSLLLKEGGRIPEAVKQIQALAKQTENPDLKLEATARSGMWLLELDPPQPTQADAEFKAAIALPGRGYWKDIAQLGQVRILSDSGKFPQVIEAAEKLGKELSPDVKPELLIILANAQRQAGKTPDALSTYAQVTKEFPGSVYDKEAQFERLRTMYSTNDDNLVAEIDKYLQVNPEAEKRDEALLMKAEVLFKKDDFTNAMPIYSTLELSRQLTGNRKAEVIFRLAVCQLQMKNTEEAIKAFSSYISGFPTHKLMPFALLFRGRAYQSTKNLAAALKDFDTIIKSYPKAPQRELALQQSALIQGQNGNNSAMVLSFKQLLKEFPETAARAEANYWIGWADFEAKSYKDAVPPLEEARKADKEQFGEKAGIRLLLSEYYLEDTTGTAREVDRYSKEGKTKVPVEILRWLGKVFFDGGSYESAEKYLLLLTPREEVQPDDYFLLGQSQLRMKKCPQAAETFRTYIKDTKLPVPRCRGLLLLAESQTCTGNLDEAQKSVDEALALQPEGEMSGRGRIAAGDIQMARRNFEEAAKIYESVAVILDDPEITPLALEKAVAAWRAAGRTEDADKTLNKLKSRYPEYQVGKAVATTPAR